MLWNVNFSLPFILQVDASDVGVRAVLSQPDEEGNAREQRFSVTEKECLAIKLGVEAFAVYLLGREFTIQMNHRALQWLSNFKL